MSETSDYGDFKKITEIILTRTNHCNLNLIAVIKRALHIFRLFQSSLLRSNRNLLLLPLTFAFLYGILTRNFYIYLMMNLDSFPEVNWVDLIVAIFLIRGGYIGLHHGFSVEFFKTLGAIASCVLSLLYYEKLGVWLAAHSFLSPQIANFLAFSFIFLCLLFIFRIVRILIFKVLHLELFYGLEKWGGLILALGRSIVLASLFLFALTLIPLPYLKDSVEQNSLSGPCLKEVAPKILDFFVQFKPEHKGD